MYPIKRSLHHLWWDLVEHSTLLCFLRRDKKGSWCPISYNHHDHHSSYTMYDRHHNCFWMLLLLYPFHLTLCSDVRRRPHFNQAYCAFALAYLSMRSMSSFSWHAYTLRLHWFMRLRHCTDLDEYGIDRYHFTTCYCYMAIRMSR